MGCRQGSLKLETASTKVMLSTGTRPGRRQRGGTAARPARRPGTWGAGAAAPPRGQPPGPNLLVRPGAGKESSTEAEVRWSRGAFSGREPTHAGRPAHMHADRHTLPPDTHMVHPPLRCRTRGLTRSRRHLLPQVQSPSRWVPGTGSCQTAPGAAGLDHGHLLLNAKCTGS